MLEGGLDLAFDLVTAEQRRGIGIELHPARILRHDLLDEGFSLFVGLGAIDQYFANILAQVVADRPDDDVVFLIQQNRRLLLAFGLLDCIPQLQQVVEVPLQLFGAAADTGGANDDAHAGRNGELAECIAQLVTLFAFDTAGNAAGARVVGHQHQVSAGQTDEGGECSALGAALFLVDLHQNLLSFGDQVLDHLPAFGFIGTLAEVFAGDFLQRQKAMPLRAELDERCLKAWFDPGDPGFVDVGFFLLATAILDIQVVQFLAIDQGDAHLFGLRRVDQHAFHLCESLNTGANRRTTPAGANRQDGAGQLRGIWTGGMTLPTRFSAIEQQAPRDASCSGA